MKKMKIVLLAFFAGAILSCASSTASISKELIIAPDPANPFQGTWIDPTKYHLHVIDGMNGEYYIFNYGIYGIGRGWTKQTIYTIEEKDDGFVTSNNWRISVTNLILNVENLTFQRVVK